MVPAVKIKGSILVIIILCVTSAYAQGESSGGDETLGSGGGEEGVCVPECHNNATCTNVNGSYACVCNAEFTGNGINCTALFTSDPCTDETHNCSQNATCKSNGNSFNCTCNSGFSGDGVNCEDINECDTSSHNCHTDANCTNNDGSYTCACNSGYNGDGISCDDINECVASTHDCDTNAGCTNNNGSFSCACNAGYTGDGKSCTDINECDTSSHNCHTNANCTNNDGSYTCACNSGYNGDGMSCTDINECVASTHDCDTNAGCTNNNGSFSCACNAGYTGDGKSCSDIDECIGSEHNCHTNATCTNNGGTFSCACKEGYSGDGTACEDIDECDASESPCQSDANCTNNEGSYTCACNPGFTQVGSNCEDIDECVESRDTCHNNAACTNNEGSYSCKCDIGYSGDGETCEDVDECQSESDNCDENALCDNTIGSFTCTCNSGYSGDGTSCEDIDECADAETNDCSPVPKGKCTNLPGTFGCSCDEGHAGNGRDCQEIELLGPMNVISKRETEASLEIVSQRRHQVYQVEVATINGDPVTSFNFTEAENTLVAQVSDLNADTEYRARVRIFVLANGVSVAPEFSPFVTFKTDASRTPANVGVPEVFNPEYNNIHSTASIIFIRRITRDMRRRLRFIVFIFVWNLRPGSVDMTMEVETNSTSNETLSSENLEDANYTMTIVEKNVDPPPENVTVTNITTNGFVIQWSPTPEAIDYQVLVDFQNSSETHLTNGTLLSVTGIPPNTAVVTSVRATILAGNVSRISNRSTEITFSTLAEGPQGLAVVVLNGNCFTIMFNAVQTAELYYVAFRNDLSLDFTLSANIEANGTLTKIVNGLTPSTNYEISVIAKVGQQNSTESTTSATTGPETVSGVSIYNVSVDGFNVEYEPVNIVPVINTSYVIKYTSSAGPKEQTSTQTDDRIAVNPISTEYNVTVAYKTTKTSTFSATVKTKIWTIDNVTSTGFILSWDQYKTAVDYNLTVTPGMPQQEQNTRTATLTGLTPGTQHTIEVSTGDKVLFTIPLLTCPQSVTSLTCSPKTLQCIDVDFDSVQSASSYSVSVTENPSAVISVNQNESSAEICNLSPGTTYTINVKAVNSECESTLVSASNCVTDEDECTTGSPCDSDANCTNTVGSFNCTCKQGFSGNGTYCEDINECATNQHDCHGDANCTNNDGSFTCDCNPGFSGDGKTCQDDDECSSRSSNNCVDNATCTNTPGTFSCSCDVGFAGNATYNCTDINECGEGTHGCDGNADCSNTIGSYSCACKIGFSGSGFACADVDECTDGYDNECGTNTDCLNNAGSYTCQCKNGFVGTAYKPGTCIEAEQLDPPVLITIDDETAVVEIQSRIAHQSYQINIYDESGNLRHTLNTTNSTRVVRIVRVVDGAVEKILQPETKYNITSKILVLQNGEVANTAESDPLEVETKLAPISTVTIFSDLTYNSTLLDRESAYFAYVTDIISSRLTAALPDYINKIVFVVFFDGSVGAVTELDTNSSSSLTIANATLVNGAISEATLSLVSPPDNVVTSSTANGFTANWDAVTGASQYVVEVECNNFTESYYVSTATAVASDLQPNTVCVFTVRAIIDGTPPELTGKTPQEFVTTLAQVPDLQVSTLGSAAIRVQFGFVNGASTYYVTLDDPSATSAAVDSGQLTDGVFTQDFTGLPSGSTYQVTVVPEVDGVNGTESTASVTLVSSVTGLEIYNVTASGFDVVYDVINLGSTAVSYVIKYNDGTTEETTESTSTQPHIPTQPITTPYDVSVVYTTATDTSADSEIVNTTVYTIDSVTTTSIALSWRALSGVTTYTTLRSPGTNDDNLIDPALSRTYTGLEPGTMYTLEVQTYFPKVSSSVTFFEITQVTVPGQVQGLTCTPSNETCFSVSWNLAGVVTSYTAEINEGMASDLDVSVNSTAPGAEVCGVETGNFYNASVYATNDAGNGTAGLITQCYSELALPTSISITVSSQTCFNITWDEIATATSYTAKLESASATTVEDTPTTNSVQICGLQPATVYNASVSATYEAGTSSFSTDIASQITAPTAQVLTFDSATTTSVTLTWAASNTATAYSVWTTQIDPTSSDSPTSQSSTDNNITITGLISGYVYSFVGYAQNDGGNSLPSTALEQISVPAAVEDFQAVTENVQLDIPFNWNSTTGASNYLLTVFKDGVQLSQVSVPGTSQTGISGIVDGEYYNVSVTAVSAARAVSQTSAPATILIQTAPSTPTNVAFENITTTGFDVTWSPSPSATSYEIVSVEILTNGSDGQTTTVTSDISSKSLTGFTTGTVYKITVRARNTGGWSLFSTEARQITVPNAVSNLTVTKPVPQTSFRLTWNPETGASLYEVTVASSGSTTSQNTSAPTVTFTSQTAGVDYTISVVAKTASSGIGTQQTSAAMELQFSTAPENSSIPTEITKNDTSLSFGWTPALGADHYDVAILESGISIQVTNATDNQTTISGLQSATCYTIQITSINAFGTSHVISGTICTKPSPPDFSVSAVTSDSISLTWPAVTGAQAYILEVTRTSNGEVVPLTNSFFTETTADIPQLDPGTNYTISLYVFGLKGNSDKTIKTQITAPGQVEGLTCTPSNETCFSVSWDFVISADSYTADVNDGTVAGVELNVDNSLPGADVCNIVTGSLYNTSVFATNTAGDGAAGIKIGCHSVLQIPVGIAITVNNQTCFTVTWNNIATAISYNVKLTNPSAITQEGGSDTLSAQLCGLQPATVYEAYVSAVYEAGESNFSTEIVSQITAPLPPSLVFTSATTVSIALSWISSDTATNYYVEATQIEPSTSDTPTTLSSSGTSVTASGLQPGYVYSFVAYAENDGGNSTQSSALEQITVPDVAVNLQAETENTQLNIPFTWDDVVGAVSYNLSLLKDGSEISQVSVSGASQNGMDGLQDGENYTLSIVAITAARMEVQVGSAATIDFQTAPSTPVNVSVSGITTESFTVSWSASKSATLYEINLIEVMSDGSDGAPKITNLTTLSQSFTGLSAGTVYKVNVRARNTGGWSLHSTDMRQITVPDPPTNLAVAMPVSQTSFTITWTPAIGAESYNVTISDGSSMLTQQSTGTSTTFTSQNPGTNYTASVVAITAAPGSGIQQTSVAVNLQFMTAPSDPGSPTETAKTATSLSFEWNDAIGADYYEVKVIDSSGNSIQTLNATDNQTSVSGLESAVCFTIEVKAINSYGASAVSSESICTKPESPSFNITAVTSNSISIAWSPVTGAIGYILKVVRTSDDAILSLPTTFFTGTTADILDLQPGTNYTISMHTVGQRDNSDITSKIQITAPGQVEGFTCMPANVTCFSVSWNSVVSAVSYTAEVNGGTELGVDVSVNDAETRADVCNIVTGSLYNTSVYATNSAGDGAPGTTTGCHSVLQVPAGIGITVDSQTCLTVTWDNIATATSYKAKLTNEIAGIRERASATTSVQLCDLEPATIYEASVSAVYEAGESNFSTEIVTQITAPIAQNLVFTSATTTSMTLSWAASVTATNYYIETEQIVPSTTDPSTTISSSDTSATVSGLIPGFVYSFVGYAENAGGNSTQGASIEQITVPSAVVNLQADTENTQLNILFTWDSVVGATSYNLMLIKDAAEISQESLVGFSLTGIDGLQDGEDYTIEIVAITAARTEVQISLPTAIDFQTAPPTPVDVSFGDITSTSFVVSWNASKSATLYEINMIQVLSDGSDGAATTINSTTLSQSFSDLTAGTVYKLTVRARNAGGWSLQSSEVRQITVPDAVTNLAVTRPVSQTSFTTTWTAVIGAEFYDVTVSDGTSSTSQQSASASVTFTSQIPGTNYTASVVAKTTATGSGIQQTSTAVELQFRTAPSNPGTPTETTKTFSSLSFEWDVAVGADYYEVIALNAAGDMVQIINETANVRTLSELTGATCYTIQITAINNFGSSAAVNGEICTKPEPPDFSISSVTTTTISLTWPAVSGSRGYILSVIRTTDNQAISLPNSFTRETTADITGLDPGTNYTITMYTIGDRDDSAEVSKTQITAPGQPQSFTCLPFNETCFALSWDSVISATSYTAMINEGAVPGVKVSVDHATPGAEVCAITTGSLYNSSVYASNSAGDGDAVFITRCHSALPVPTDVAIEVDSQTCFTVMWTAIATAVSYNVQLTSTSAVTVEGTSFSTFLQLCTLQPATVYQAAVSATYEAGDSDFSTDSVSQITAPIAPTLEFVSATTGSISLSWVAPNTATNYYIETTQIEPSSVDSTITESTSANTISISSLEPGFVYRFVAYAENDGGNSTASASLDQISVPSAILNLQADTENTQLDIPISWSVSTGAASYNISVTKDGAVVAQDSIVDTTWNGITGIEHGQTYSISVTAITSARAVSQTSDVTTIVFLTAPSAPTAVSIQTITQTSFVVSWAQSNTATLYEIKAIEVLPNGSVGSTVVANTSELSLTKTSLKPGHVYRISVRARNAGGWSAESVEQRQITVPDAPTNLSVTTPVPQTSFRLTWDSVTGAASYDVTVTSGSSTVTQQSIGPSITFTSQSVGESYSVEVVALTAETGSGSQQSSAATPITFMTAPENSSIPTEDTKTASSLSFRWISAFGANYYEVQIIGASGTVLQIVNVTSNETSVTGLQSATCYTIHIMAVNDFGVSAVISGEICTKPESPDFSIAAVTTTSISLSWEAVPGFIGYIVEVVRTSDGQPVSLPESYFRGTTADIPGLEPGTYYNITMYTVGARDNSDRNTKTQVTAPGEPQNFMCSPSNGTCFHLTWDPVETATSYTPQVNDGNIVGVGIDLNNAEPGAEVCKIVTGSLYNASVYATNTAGNGDAVSVEGCHSELPPPSNVVIAVDSQTCFTVSWDMIPTANSYKARLRSSSAGTIEGTSSTTSVQLCDLQPATVYEASVLVAYEAGDSVYSSETVTQITAPIPPTLEFFSATTTSISISWVATDTTTNYHVQTTLVNPSSSDPPTSQTITGTTTTISGLQPGHVYSFVAYAENNGGNSTTSTVLEQITVPSAVSNFLADTENTQLNIPFAWDETTGAASYNITVTKDGAEIVADSVTNTAWLDIAGIEEGEAYDISIIAITDEKTFSQTSSPTSLSFLTAPPMPINVMFDTISSESFAITWGASKSATLYEYKVVEILSDGSDGDPVVRNTSSLSETVNGLRAGTVYKVTVRAKNAGGWSIESAEVRQITVPDAVTNLEVLKPVPQTSFRLTWDKVTGAASYNVTIASRGSSVTNQIVGTTITFTSQQPGENYTATVIAITPEAGSGLQQSGPASTQLRFKTAPENPGTPTLISKNDTSMTFEWTASVGADYYQLKIVDASSNTVEIRNETSNEAILSGLEGASCYTIEITAFNEFGSSSPSTESICTKPASPDFTITDVTTATISLNWPSITGAVGYSIEVVRADDGRVVSLPTSFFRGTSADITELEAGTYYNITMQTVGITDTSAKTTKSQVTVPAEVQGLVCSPLNETCFTTSWDSLATVNSYSVEIRDGSAVDVRVDHTMPGAEVCDVTTGTLYNASVFGTNEAGNGGPVTLTGCHSVLPAPTNIAIEVDSQTCLTVTWNSVAEGISYNARLTSTTATNEELEVTTNSVQFCGLVPATLYQASVSATYAAGPSDFSTDDVSQITAPTPPLLTFVSATTTNISLAWEISNTATIYHVETTQIEPSSSDPTTTQSTSDSTITKSGLQPGFVYSFTAYSENDGGRSTPSSPLEQITAPNAVQDLQAGTENVQLNIMFTWSPTTGAVSYNIAITNLDGTVVSETTLSETSWDGITGIEDGEQYTATVTALTNARTTVQTSEPSSILFQTAPPTPVDVSIISIETTTLGVSWSTSRSATLYEITLVERLQDGSDGVTRTENSTDLSQVFSELIAGTVYKITVRARNEGGWSLKSTEMLQTTVPNAITNLAVTMPVAQTFFRLTWTASVGAAYYDITITSGTSTVTEQSVGPSATFTSQQPGMDYTVLVVAKTAASGFGIQQTSVATELQLRTAPENASIPTATSKTESSISIRWVAALGADHYEVQVFDTSGNLIQARNETLTDATLSELMSATCYDIQITAINNFGISALIRGTICTTPESPAFVVSAVTTNSISLTWDSIPRSIEYIVEVVRSSDGQVVPISDNPIENTMVDIIGLDPGTEYDITMYTVGENDDSARRTETQITVPSAPALSLTVRATDQLQYTWSAVTGAHHYMVAFHIASETTATNLNVTEASVAINNLEPGTVYSVNVSSMNSAGSSTTTVQHSTVISTGPTISSSEVTTTGFIISFSDVTDRESFDVLVEPGGLTIPTTSTSVSVTGLTSGTSYSVVVIVNYQTVGQSAGSTPASVTTLTDSPTNFVVSSNTQNEGITLSWDSSSGDTSYKVMAITPTSTASYDVNSPTILIPTTLGSVYNFTVQGINNDGLFSAPATMNNVEAAAVKVFTFEVTLSPVYTFTVELEDQTSSAFISLAITVQNSLSIIFINVQGFVGVTVTGFFQGSVVARFEVTIDDPNANETQFMLAFDAGADNTTTFDTSVNITTRIDECRNIPSVCDQNAECNDTVDSYICTCSTGYTGDGETCSDVNECDSSPCHANADCTNTPGTYSCACKVGYEGDGFTCEDQNECATSGICGGSSTCENSIGSFTCACPAGYTYIVSDCVDNDECDTNPCVRNAQCSNTEGSYMCSCNSGYTGDVSSSCVDLVECDQTPAVCTVNQKCGNTEGSYNCACKSGYEPNADGDDCIDQDECATFPCHEVAASCTNYGGGYSCACDPGYTGDGVTSCFDFDECLADENICGSNATCENEMGGYICLCKAGYSGITPTQCIDIDECSSENQCEPHGGCANTVGSYFCVCDSGYVDHNGACVDKDECAANKIACSNRATCVNFEGSYRCDCIGGYTGSNDICADIDECASPSDPCGSTENYECVNNVGSFTCNCASGYEENAGGTCVNIDECSGSAACPSDRDCRDIAGSYQCNCRHGYTGTTCISGQECTTCVDFNECETGSDNCHRDADCTNVEGSFTCTCKEYFVGSGIDCTGNVTVLYLVQTTTKYEYTSELARATATLTDLTTEVESQVELQFQGFVFVEVRFTSGSGTSIIATYAIETAMPIERPVDISQYYQSNVGDTALFSTDPVLEQKCGLLATCGSNNYCAEYNGVATCSCNAGYTKNSSNQCEDDDECSTSPSPCHERATCANSDGSFSCNCNSGFSGDGTSCEDIDECANATTQCIENSICSNSVGSYSCDCAPGFISNADNTTCTDQCEDFSCSNGGTCVPSPTSDTPTCECTADYQGPKCEDFSLYRILAITFGVIGGVLLLVLIIVLIVFIVKRKRGGNSFLP